MASKYLQKYPIPAGFPEILTDFTREVLRDQPSNIIEYAATYFEMLEKGKKIEFDSKHNVKKEDKKYELSYNPKNADQITKKASSIANKMSAGAQNINKQQPQKKQNDAYGGLTEEQYYAKKDDEQLDKLVNSYYEHYDENKSGFLQKQQFDKMAEIGVQQIGYQKPNQAKLKKFRDAIDLDGDGKISKQQFKKQVRELFSIKFMKDMR